MRRTGPDDPYRGDAHRTLDLGTDPVIRHRHHTVVHRVVVDGRSVVVKRARGRARLALRAEAAVLEHLPTGTTVSLVSVRETDDHTDLVLTDAGVHDLGRPERLDDRSLRIVLADTVRSVHRLHESNWVHGALCAEHVVLDTKHRPTLCSVGSARRATPGDVLNEHRQLVTLVTGALQRHANSDRPWHERRSSRSLAERIRRTIDHATPLDPDALVELLEPDPLDSRRPRWFGASALPATPHLPLGAVAATVALCALAAVLVVSRGPYDATPETPVGLSVAQPASLQNPAGHDPVRHVAGHIVERNGVQYAVGRAGDRVVLGDWDCAGTITPALLRPRTGEVHLFDGWALPGVPISARLLTTQLGATELRVDPRRCARLQIRGADGSILELPTDDRISSTPHEEDTT